MRSQHRILYNLIMAISITSTELARKLGDFLARVRYRRESFVVERGGVAIARVIPPADMAEVGLAEALAAWTGAAPVDPGFAGDLERVAAGDRPPKNPWVS